MNNQLDLKRQVLGLTKQRYKLEPNLQLRQIILIDLRHLMIQNLYKNRNKRNKENKKSKKSKRNKKERKINSININIEITLHTNNKKHSIKSRQKNIISDLIKNKKKEIVHVHNKREEKEGIHHPRVIQIEKI